MRSISKSLPLSLRLTVEQRRRLTRAAEIVSRRKGERVEPSRLLRELGMERVDEILRNAA